MPAHISVRESIRWLPDEASEPTSTIVLTSPGGLFVDLRFILSEKQEKSNNNNQRKSLSLSLFSPSRFSCRNTIHLTLTNSYGLKKKKKPSQSPV